MTDEFEMQVFEQHVPECECETELLSVEEKVRMEKEKGESDRLGVGIFVLPEKKTRPVWASYMESLTSLISNAVGLGNFWRFPYLAQKYGGGAFIIPYLIMLFIVGLPGFFNELGLGQRLRGNAIQVWERFHPYLKGIGIASMLCSIFIGLYYNMINAWCLYYLFNSFQVLPYADCPIFQNISEESACNDAVSTEWFWFKTTLDASSGIDEDFTLTWWNCLCLLLAWLVVFIGIWKGIESSGKVMYFTATFPYIVTFIFMINGLLLPGSSNGLHSLFTPNWSAMLDPEVWMAAASQIFFSLSISMGGVTSFASYNPRKQDVMRDTLIICFVNSFTSILNCVNIFSVLGFRAHQKTELCISNNTVIMSNYFASNVTAENYDMYFDKYNSAEKDKPLFACNIETYLNEKSQGTGLAFVAFTEAIKDMPGAPFWSVLYFLMLLSLGLGTMFGVVEGIVVPLEGLVGKKVPRLALNGIVCVACYLIGLLFCTRSGIYLLELFNTYAGALPLLMTAFCEVMVTAWGYGTRRFDEDIFFMRGGPISTVSYILHWYFRISLTFITPFTLFVILMSSTYSLLTKPLVYDTWINGRTTKYQNYPGTAKFVIAVLNLIPILIIPGYAVYKWVKTRMSHKKNEGILCGRKWSFSNVAFWRNKYDENGTLKHE